MPFLVAIGYAAALFALAALAESRRQTLGRSRLRLPAYALALPVYCTSWTFFGAVGSSVAEGWNYVPIYLGPILVYLFAPGFLRALVREVQAEGATSISDFIGSRFGKSRGVAALVTLLALFGSIPYLALQLRSIGTGYVVITGKGGPMVPMTVAALLLGLFAIAFGTRRYVASSRNEAVLYVIAIESLVKLAAMVVIGLFAALLFLAAPDAQRIAGAARFGDIFALRAIDGDFLVICLLSMAAILCLPRQFYIGVIGAGDPEDAMRARWPFALYLVVIALVVLPISLAGMTVPPPGIAPDLLVLGLPLYHGEQALALFAFLGGFSAATGMVVVETIALSTMLSNDLIAPLMLRRSSAGGEADLGRMMLHVRRVVIVAVMGAALAYARTVSESERLAVIGLTAFAAMAQFAPALILAVRRGNRDAAAAKAGLLAGLAVWGYTLFLPELAAPDLLKPLHGTLADPLALMGLTGLSPISHGALWSLGANMLAFGLVSARRGTPLAHGFGRNPRIAEARTIGDLMDMAARFAGTEEVKAAFGAGRNRAAPIGRADARLAERLIAGVIGGPSARAIMASALSGARLGVAEVARLLDQSGQSLQFSKGLLAATLENIDPGVSVIDHNQRLIAWNSRYLDLFGYPPDLVYVGALISELIRYNAERGECGPGEVDAHVEKRLDHMRRGAVHSFERVRPDGRVVKTVGGPMPGGGYVMCFTDITTEAEARAGLERARVELESRVEQRTRELRAANDQLSRADAEKTRFLAAASHDLLQPIHAARLFTAGLDRQLPESQRPLLGRVSSSIEAAEALLRSLLDISKLDAGGVQPAPMVFAVRPLLVELAQIFMPQAAEKGLSIHIGPGDALVETDRSLLQSIVQNFLSNAVRYTARGGVAMGVRRRGGAVRIEVYDSGPGIEDADRERIFREFERLGTGGEAGIGLGLAIVERTARLLGATVDLRSRPGRGSRFAVELPVATGRMIVPSDTPDGIDTPACGRHVLVVDDDAEIRAATALLLRQNGFEPLVAEGPDMARSLALQADSALVDFHMGDNPDGLLLIAALRALHPTLRCALVTADRSEETIERCRRRHIAFFPKPADPERLIAWLGGSVVRAAE